MLFARFFGVGVLFWPLINGVLQTGGFLYFGSGGLEGGWGVAGEGLERGLGRGWRGVWEGLGRVWLFF